MSPIKKHISLILTIIILVLFHNNSKGQTNEGKIKTDSSKTITLSELNIRVDRAILLLKTKQLLEISDSDHINIMLCNNTISHYIDKNLEIRLIGGRYRRFMKMMDKTNYVTEILKVYPNYMSNKGLGWYFPELKMELNGLPGDYAMFNIKEK